VAKTDFLSEKIKIKGTPCSFQVASVRKKWAMRVIDEKESKVLKVVKLDKITSATITDNIRDIVGRKYSLKDYPIDELDLGSKMAKLLRDVDTFQKTGVAPKPISQEPTGPKISVKKPTRQPDSFWSAYSSAVTNPTAFVPEQPTTQPESTETASTSESMISFTQPSETSTAPTQPTPTPPQPSTELDESLSILGVTCPVCGAEIDIDSDVCPSCGTKIED